MPGSLSAGRVYRVPLRVVGDQVEHLDRCVVDETSLAVIVLGAR